VDRVIQQTIVLILTPIFDPEFSESSFGYRPFRSALGAVKQVQKIIRSGRRQPAEKDHHEGHEEHEEELKNRTLAVIFQLGVAEVDQQANFHASQFHETYELLVILDNT